MPTPRAYVSEFTLRVGPINALGKLVKLTKTKANENNQFVSLCPDCDLTNEYRRVSQQYICAHDEDHGPFVQRELTVKGRDIGDGVFARVSADEVAAARTSELPLNLFDATVHPKADVEAATYSDDNAYVFVPRVADEYFAVLVKMIEDDDNAFVAMANVRNSEGFFGLRVWNGQIVLQKLLWPEDLNEFDVNDTEASDDLFEAAKLMLGRISAPFDADTYRSGVRDRLSAINDAMTGDSPEARVERASAPATNLLAALESFGQ